MRYPHRQEWKSGSHNCTVKFCTGTDKHSQIISEGKNSKVGKFNKKKKKKIFGVQLKLRARSCKKTSDYTLAEWYGDEIKTGILCSMKDKALR